MNRSSTTAVTVALQRAFESRRPADSRLFVDPYAMDFLTGGWRALATASGWPLVGPLAPRLYDAVVGPGPRPSAVARTRFIDDAIAAELDGDPKLRQLVILGAGFDSRAHRLTAARHCRVFEVDHPATQATKRERIAACDRPVHPVTYVPVDFEVDDLGAALDAAGFDRTKPALVLWEGVTNYLTASAVDATLATVHALCACGGTLVFTYIDAGVLDGSASFPEAARWMRGVERVGEPWTFGLRPPDVSAFLTARGYALVADESTAAAGDPFFEAQGRRDRGSGLYRIVVAHLEAACPR